jgi:cytochrome c553
MKQVLIVTLALAVASVYSLRAADAKENWEKNCQKCHGPDGKGQTPMGKKLRIKDYSDPKVQATLKEDEMIKTIKEGKKEGDSTRMKAFGEVLNDDEIKAMVKFFRTLKK